MPGCIWCSRWLQGVAMYDTRDQIFQTAVGAKPADALKVQTKEGVSVGLAVAVRYRIDPSRLASCTQTCRIRWRSSSSRRCGGTFPEIAPNYLVRDLFGSRREELRREAAAALARRLAPDAIVVKEVMVRDTEMPAEYSRGLESVLLKEQENERLGVEVEVEVKAKQVRTAELEAEVEKARQVKAAEAESQVTVLRAKAQADSMQYTCRSSRSRSSGRGWKPKPVHGRG
jgi:regulator of protease activity HflC (stomatin/prohibitin superfamily)